MRSEGSNGDQRAGAEDGRQACCCGAPEAPPAETSYVPATWVSGTVQTPVGDVRRVSHELIRGDRLGAWRVRWGIGRDDYRVSPDLYALGTPDADAPVLVTANYKLTVDQLRSSLSGLDAWLLVVDTRGINVWCAAGKGTFCAEEVARMVLKTQLAEIVRHRRLVLPQLSAPGVAAHRVKEECGFRAVLADRCAPPACRRSSTEPCRPIQRCRSPSVCVGARCSCRWALRRLGPADAAGLRGPAGDLRSRWRWCLAGAGREARRARRRRRVACLAGRQRRDTARLAVAAGPCLLVERRRGGSGSPPAPGRTAFLPPFVAGCRARPSCGRPGGPSHAAMNFTGCSTVTSPSGVEAEMRRALPLQVAGCALAGGAWLASRVGR